MIPISTSAARFIPSNTITTTYNLILVTSGLEYQFDLPSNTKSFSIRIRTLCFTKIAYTVGGTSTDWETIPAGTTYNNIQFYSNQSIFLNATINNVVAEILCHQ